MNINNSQHGAKLNHSLLDYGQLGAAKVWDLQLWKISEFTAAGVLQEAIQQDLKTLRDLNISGIVFRVSTRSP